MKRKFAVLVAVLGALALLALPASSMADMYPASAKFEITGLGKIGTALGSCTLGKSTGQVPAAPINEVSGATVPVSVPPVESCSTGMSLTLTGTGGTWNLIGAGLSLAAITQTSGESVTLRFASLPGCKLSGAMSLLGVWSNGAQASFQIPVAPGYQNVVTRSTYHAHSASPLTWANDGGTCALAGKKEVVSYSDETVSGVGTEQRSFPVVHQIINLAATATPVYMTP